MREVLTKAALFSVPELPQYGYIYMYRDKTFRLEGDGRFKYWVRKGVFSTVDFSYLSPRSHPEMDRGPSAKGLLLCPDHV